MPRQLDLIERPPRQKPRHLMHVMDAASDMSEGRPIVKFSCRRCGARTGWMTVDTVTEAKRGIPCEICKQSQ